MLACHVDDVIAFLECPMEIIDEIKKTCMPKGIGEPKSHLGGDVLTLNEHWQKQGATLRLSAKTHVKSTVEKFERVLKTNFKTEQTPMAEGDHPELDDSDFCTPLQHAQFRALIGSANWCITLGSFDTVFATQLLAHFDMAPCIGHLK